MEIQLPHKLIYVPLLSNVKIRTTIGFFLLFLAVLSVDYVLGNNQIKIILPLTTIPWILSVLVTDKYVHKYPQRYCTYLLAAHLKAATVMAFILWILGMLAGPLTAPPHVLWAGYVLFVFLDILPSTPYRQNTHNKSSQASPPAPHGGDAANNLSTDGNYLKLAASLIDKQTLLTKINPHLDKPFFDFIEINLPDIQGGTGEVLILDDKNTTDNHSSTASVGILIGRTRINDVLRLNQYMQFCTERISMGGYFIIRYLPFENLLKNMKAHYKGLFYWTAFILHFIWYRAIPKLPWLEKLYFTPILSWLDIIHLSFVKKRNRALSKAEVWGRLSFYGMTVLAESEGDGELFIIAQRITSPVQNKTPSFYFIASLEKVGLDGKSIHTHKIRTMYPFSEFLQKRIFEDHGLATTGKFANDFRLTGYGRFLRKYWLDELPQIFDWLRGDVKLVGMRATSRHFLSLYPKELYDLYIQIKPGLIPPIFDESTNGFADIVAIELTYLRSYFKNPICTDIRYLTKTFTDIVFKGVRSK